MYVHFSSLTSHNTIKQWLVEKESQARALPDAGITTKAQRYCDSQSNAESAWFSSTLSKKQSGNPCRYNILHKEPFGLRM